MDSELIKTVLTDRDEKIYELMSKGDFGQIATLLCTKLEAVLKYVFHFDGELYEMINKLRNIKSIELTKNQFDSLYKMRQFRNATAHAGVIGDEKQITSNDVFDVINVFKIIDR